MKELKKLFNFKNKVVFISGCNGQIGQSLVNLFLKLNAKVYGVDKKKTNIKKNNFSFIQGNICNQNEIIKIFNGIVKREKKIDIIINNAATAIFGKLINRTDKEIEDVFKTNVASIINIIKNYTIIFDNKKLKKGKIINIGSIYGFLSPDFKIYSNGNRLSSEIYGASKSSVIQLTKYFAVLLAKKNINVNCISPGGILNKKLQSKKFIKNYIKRVPKNRMGKVEDLHTAIIYLASDFSDYTTGQNIIVDGGLSLS
jgi:NAD(P)-dependent dehydrogenase (short-subunit alcohol dehydrogenase family)